MLPRAYGPEWGRVWHTISPASARPTAGLEKCEIVGTACRVSSHVGVNAARNVSILDGSEAGAKAPLAQSAERLHGKEKVYGSIP